MIKRSWIGRVKGKKRRNLRADFDASIVTTGPPKYWNPSALPGPPALSPSRSEENNTIGILIGLQGKYMVSIIILLSVVQVSSSSTLSL